MAVMFFRGGGVNEMAIAVETAETAYIGPAAAILALERKVKAEKKQGYTISTFTPESINFFSFAIANIFSIAFSPIEPMSRVN